MIMLARIVTVWMALGAVACAADVQFRVADGVLQRRFVGGELGQITTRDGVVVKLLGANIPTGWNNGLRDWTPEAWRRDLDTIASNGMNAVRIFLPFVPPNGAGHPTNRESTDYLRELGYLKDGKLREFVADAEKRGISVTVSFFDLNRSVPAAFDDTDLLYRAQSNYLKKVVEALRDSSWVVYDLMNEPENHLISLPERDRAHAREWIKTLARDLRKIDADRHLIFLHTMSADRMLKSGLMEDQEFWGLFDGLTIHTGDTRELFVERAGEIPELIRTRHPGLILMWGEFGGGAAGDGDTAAYVRRAIRQLEINDTAGGYLWQLKSTGLDGKPMTDQEGKPHPTGIEDKPAVLAVLKELAPGFATPLSKPVAHGYSVVSRAGDAGGGEPVALADTKQWQCRGVKIQVGGQTVELEGMAASGEVFGGATAALPSVDLDAERLTLVCDIKELEGEYFVFVGDGQRMVYVVRDSDRIGVRPAIDLTRLLVDAGFHGRLNNLQIQVGLVNTEPGARSTEGSKAKMILILKKSRGHTGLESRPGKLVPADSKQ